MYIYVEEGTRRVNLIAITLIRVSKSVFLQFLL